MKDHQLQELIASAAWFAQIHMDRYIPRSQRGWKNWREESLASHQSLANKLASGSIQMDLIMTNPDMEVLSREEAKKITKNNSGKCITRLTILLQANPAAAKNIRLVTFERRGNHPTNSRLSEKLMKIFKDNWGKMYFDPNNISELSHDDQTPNSYSVNMSLSANNSYTTRYMWDLRAVRALEKNGVEIHFKPFKDSKGAGEGLMLDYSSIAKGLYLSDQRTSTINLQNKQAFSFAEFLPNECIERYSENLRINTPWGIVWVNDTISVNTAMPYNFTKGFDMYIHLGENGKKHIGNWKPEVIF